MRMDKGQRQGFQGPRIDPQSEGTTGEATTEVPSFWGRDQGVNLQGSKAKGSHRVEEKQSRASPPLEEETRIPVVWKESHRDPPNWLGIWGWGWVEASILCKRICFCGFPLSFSL